MRTRFLLLPLALAALGLVPLHASAQMDCLPPGAEEHPSQPVCNFPPMVAVSPSSVSVSQPSVPVTLTGYDHLAHGDTASFRILLDSVDVTQSWHRTTSITGWGTGVQWNVSAEGVVPLSTAQPVRTVEVVLCDAPPTGPECTTRTATYRLSLPGVEVTPDAQAIAVPQAATRTTNFTVTNSGTQGATFLLAASCRDGVSGAVVAPCAPGVTSVSPAPGASQAVSVTYPASPVGRVVQVQLEATQAGAPGVRDAGWKMVTVSGSETVQRAPTYILLDSAATVDRGQCVTVAMGPAAAYECGDLRLAHALPAHRTKGRGWAPVLLYNSQHASPRPTVYADVTLPADAIIPASVQAVVTLANGPSHSRTFSTAGWAPGTTRRIGVQWDGSALNTGVYTYTLQVTNQYSGSAAAGPVLTGALAVVNRSGSAFGAGWWLAGWEQLVDIGNGRRLWVGGDGSTRIYLPAVAGQTVGTWTAKQPDGPPETMTRASTSSAYVRKLRGGGEIHFDASGFHLWTVNRLGQVTGFEKQGAVVGKVVTPATGGGERAWSFAYDAQGRLWQVTAPVPGATRNVTLAYGTGRGVTQITDPDGHDVRFLYSSGSTTRINARYGRDDALVGYGYDAAGKVSWAKTYMAGTAAHGDMTSYFQAAEGKGVAWDLATAVAAHPLATAYTRIDGPRTDVADHTYLWLGRWGAPVRIRDAAGAETRVVRGDTRFPALATQVVDAAGLVTTAHYDAGGRPDSVRVLNPLGNGVNSVTRYQWDTTWEKPVRIEAPGAAATTMAYDTANGNTLWQQQASDTTRFTYHASGAAAGQLATVTAPRNGADPPSVERLEYDAFGNLRKTVNALGHLTLVYRDAFGRDTLVVTPTDAATAGDSAALRNSRGVRQRTAYDLMGRDTLTRTIGPATTHTSYASFVPAASPLETLTVWKTYDVAGRLTNVARSVNPDLAQLNGLFTNFEFDRAGRVVREEDSQSGIKANTYDPAGNVLTTTTPRGHEIRMKYDVAGRMVERFVPGVTYGQESTGPTLGYLQFSFPVYPNAPGNSFQILDETTHFRFDQAGRMVHAENREAIVRRTYFPNGALRTDSLMLGDYSSPGSYAHTYGLQYGYDAAGRVTSLTHPTNLVSSQNVDGFGYDPVTGSLVSAVERTGVAFSFRYDRLRRMTAATMPGAVVDSLRYDVAGRAVWRHEWGPSGTIHQQTMEYDGRGKLAFVSDRGFGYRQWYSGIGSLAGTAWDNIGIATTEVLREEFRTDALGNVSATRTSRGAYDPGGMDYPWIQSWYQPLGARVTTVFKTPPSNFSSDFHQDSTTRAYDASGNVIQSWRMVGGPGSNGTTVVQTEESRSYYGADERLRVFQEWDLRRADEWGNTKRAGVWEEYRYDPLGRRILVRKRTDSSLCDVDASWECLSTVTRFVWAGDQILWEMRSTSTNLEDGGEQVSYFHAGGIDRPLLISKSGVQIVPHQNWRGVFSAGTYGSGSLVGKKSDCMVFPPQNCTPVDWPGVHTTAWHQRTTGEIRNWFGSLATGMRDASGQTYMRNRYYDPATGQFTQPDPIGLAGGLNSYGFAAGDPVTYSDPYGLCAQASGDTIPKVEVCSAVADIPGNVINLQHKWLRTDSKEAGLGQAGGGVPGEGEYRVEDNSPYVTMTEITDHSGRGNAPGATCAPIPNVNAQCVNNQLQIGQSRGRWSGTNQCQTFVRQVLSTCSEIPMTVQRDATNIAPPPVKP